jgi:hypothetical protein
MEKESLNYLVKMTGNESETGFPVWRIRQLGKNGEADYSLGVLPGCAQVTIMEVTFSLSDYKKLGSELRKSLSQLGTKTSHSVIFVLNDFCMKTFTTI